MTRIFGTVPGVLERPPLELREAAKIPIVASRLPYGPVEQ